MQDLLDSINQLRVGRIHQASIDVTHGLPQDNKDCCRDHQADDRISGRKAQQDANGPDHDRE